MQAAMMLARGRDFARVRAVMMRVLSGIAGAAVLLLVATATPAAAQSKTGAHAYMLRGLMNVFSLGLDELASDFEKRGIRTSVWNHVAWNGLAEQAAADYKSGRVRTIILVGHSLGARAVVSMVERLGELGVPVALAVTLDHPTVVISRGRANRFVNLYFSNGWGGPFTKGPAFRGSLANIDLAKRPELGHFNIDKAPYIHKMIVGYVNQAVRTTHKPAAAAPAAAAPAETQTVSVSDGTQAATGAPASPARQ
ncbi:MAG: hypothetical protein HY056_12345 [Proteobacteria bacterium]|nr:hypothetical protein [Pseudomonadota bacterium]